MPNLQSPLGVAIIGTGFGQKVHLPALQDCDRTQPIAIYHRDRAKAEAIAQAHQIPYAFNTLDTLLAHPNIQAICLSTPPFLHHEMAQQTLAAGKHLFLEKPTAMSVAEAKSIYHQTQQTGLQTILNFEFRFIPAWMALKAQLETFAVGKPRLIKIDWIVPGRADPNRPWSWHASSELGGGSLGALGSHVFDYIHWLFGPVKQLCGRLITSIAHRPDPISGMPKVADADDTCLIGLELPDGTPIQVNISATAYSGRGHWVEVYGDRGTLVLGSNHPTDYVHGFKLWGSSNGEPLTELVIPSTYDFPKTYPDGRIAPVKRAIEHWVNCIEQKQTHAPSIQEGLYSQLLMDLTHQSHQTGCWVDVPPLETLFN